MVYIQKILHYTAKKIYATCTNPLIYLRIVGDERFAERIIESVKLIKYDSFVASNYLFIFADKINYNSYKIYFYTNKFQCTKI